MTAMKKKVATVSSTKKAVAQKTVKKVSTKAHVAPPVVSSAERHRMIEQAAYFRAEKLGFKVDCHENWLAAEKEVDRLLKRK